MESGYEVEGINIMIINLYQDCGQSSLLKKATAFLNRIKGLRIINLYIYCINIKHLAVKSFSCKTNNKVKMELKVNV
ncbi:CLUMA_CG020340, isoform A [Clunio marinus]|uniref:CLUMA_CG020340, isoform A n=1 Tax=Clunio marinus TaxID=568069 RepID=A0A1J1J5U3_9DIPT|nr:CLUMA_CG020340, isoform A [Clunio marinus]